MRQGATIWTPDYPEKLLQSGTAAKDSGSVAKRAALHAGEGC